MILISIPAGADGPKQEYVIVLNPTRGSVAEAAQEIAGQHRADVGFLYTTALQGFTVTVPEQAAAAISRNPRVAYVEPVYQVEAVGTQPIPTGIDRIEGDVNPPSIPMDVDIAILDTGVYIGTREDGSARSHLDLNLRWVSDCTGAILYPLLPGGCSGSGDFQDHHGHGTHVAGIAAALDNDIGSIGVAPGATLHSFKVLQADGTGTTGMILAGIDAVTIKAAEIEVANMSLGFVGYSQAINDAIANSTDAGVTWVVAAGNDGILASEFSPANSPDVITVSALADFDGLPGGQGQPTCRSDVDDTLADFSNYGPAVEIAAPGVCIFSTYLEDGYAVLSGTSMASPFVAGAVARYIAETGAATDDRADVQAIKAAVIGAGAPQDSACGFTDIDNSPEPLLFVNAAAYGGGGSCGDTLPPPGNTPPTASFDAACIDLDCTFTNTSFDLDTDDTLSHMWEFGDGATSTETNPSHTYAAGGSYQVTLTVDDGTATSSITEEVEVSEQAANQPPSAGFSAACTDLQCVFNDESSDPDTGTVLTYSWDFGDGATSTQADPSHTYSGAGSFTVELTVSDGEFSDLASTVVEVTEPADPTLIGGTVNPIVSTGREVEAAIAVYDDQGDFVGDATVEGEFIYSDRNGRSRTAAASAVSESGDIGYNGFVANTLVEKKLPPQSTVTGFCITSISAPGYTYVTTGFECWPWGS
ncbi:MAG: S8 family serine peptidase [Acidimicrobiia bacterium]|jgi:PKD repeat protein